MRKSIPKSLKNKVWDTYIGKEKGVGECLCCGGKIDSKNFDCGHVTAVKHNGKNTLENLRPICSPKIEFFKKSRVISCNKSMGDENLFKFKEKYFPKCESLLEKLVEENKRVVKNYIFENILRF